MSYNLTFMENITNYLQVIQSVNTASGNLLGTLILFILWIGTYVVMQRDGDQIQAFIGSSVATSVLGIILLLLDVVTWPTLILPLTCTLLGTVFYAFTN